MDSNYTDCLITNLPLVSIIVPVWNDAHGLAACLSGIRAQSYPAAHIQLIVVDNGSSDGSVEIAKSFEEALTLSEPVPGSYAARNAGLRQARGDYVAFIDSDCVPHETWIEEGIAAALREPNLGIVGGRVEIDVDDCSRPSAAALYERMFSFNQELNTMQGTCIAANWLSSRSILECFGGFDASVKSGGDSKLSRRISQAGHTVLYCDTMVVYHPARGTLRALTAKRRRVVGGKWATATGPGPKAIRLAAVLTWDAILRTFRTLGVVNLRVTERLQIVAVIGTIWVAGLAELARLVLGFEPRR